MYGSRVALFSGHCPRNDVLESSNTSQNFNKFISCNDFFIVSEVLIKGVPDSLQNKSFLYFSHLAQFPQPRQVELGQIFTQKDGSKENFFDFSEVWTNVLFDCELILRLSDKTTKFQSLKIVLQALIMNIVAILNPIAENWLFLLETLRFIATLQLQFLVICLNEKERWT